MFLRCSLLTRESHSEFESHYQIAHRHKCQQCSRVFPSVSMALLMLTNLSSRIVYSTCTSARHTTRYSPCMRNNSPWYTSKMLMSSTISLIRTQYECLVSHCGLKFWSRKDRKTHLMQVSDTCLCTAGLSTHARYTISLRLSSSPGLLENQRRPCSASHRPEW